ncbi:MAG: hypothetical protein WC636_05405, partial [Candidatus Margulisiibacteriota bacterium]
VIVIDAGAGAGDGKKPAAGAVAVLGEESAGNLDALIAEMQKQNLPKKQISKIAARCFSLSAKEVYKRLIGC